MGGDIKQLCIKPASYKAIQLWEDITDDEVLKFCDGIILDKIVSYKPNSSFYRTKFRLRTGNNQLVDIKNGDWLLKSNETGKYYSVSEETLNTFFLPTDQCAVKE